MNLTDQAIGFLLKVEAKVAIDELRKTEAFYTKLDKAVAQVGDSFTSTTDKFISATDKLLSGTSKFAQNLLEGLRTVFKGNTDENADLIKAEKAVTAQLKDEYQQRLDNMQLFASQVRKIYKDLKETVGPDFMQAVNNVATGKSEGGTKRGADSGKSVGDAIGDLNNTLKQGQAKKETDPKNATDTVRDALKEAFGPDGKALSSSAQGAPNAAAAPNLSDLIEKLNALKIYHDIYKAIGLVNESIKALTDVQTGNTVVTAPVAFTQQQNDALDEKLKNLEQQLVETIAGSGGLGGQQPPTSPAGAGGFDLGKYLGKGGMGNAAKDIASFAAGVVTLEAAINHADKFQQKMLEIRKESRATQEQLNKMGDVALDVSLKTNQAAEDIAEVAGEFRKNAGFTEIDDQFKSVVETSTKLGVITNTNGADMARFIAQVSMGMKVGKENVKEFGAALLIATKDGGVSMQELQSNIENVKSTIRRLNLTQGESLHMTEAIAAATKAVGQSYGDTAGVSEFYNNIVKMSGKARNEMIAVIQQADSSFDPASTKEKLQTAEGALELYQKYAEGAALVKKRYQQNFEMGGVDNIAGFGNIDRLTDAAAAFEKFGKAKDEALANSKSKGGKTIEDEFNEMFTSLDALKTAAKNLSHTFMVMVGKPILQPLITGLTSLLNLVNKIPAPIVRVAAAFGSVWTLFTAFKKVKLFEGWITKAVELAKETRTVTSALGRVSNVASKLQLLVNPWVLLAAAMTAVGVIATKVMSDGKWASWLNLLKGFGELKGEFVAFGEVVKAFFTGDWANGADLLTNFVDSFTKTLETLPDTIMEYLADIPEALDKWMNSFDLGDFADKIASYFTSPSTVGKILKALGKLWVSMVKFIYVQGPILLGSLVTTLLGGLLKVIGRAQIEIGRFLFKGLLDIFKTGLQKIEDWLKSKKILGISVGKMIDTLNKAEKFADTSTEKVMKTLHIKSSDPATAEGYTSGTGQALLTDKTLGTEAGQALLADSGSKPSNPKLSTLPKELRAPEKGEKDVEGVRAADGIEALVEQQQLTNEYLKKMTNQSPGDGRTSPVNIRNTNISPRTGDNYMDYNNKGGA